MPSTSASRPRVCAVSYLNTSPLVWGMLHGPQQGAVDLDFQIPSECADRLASGRADLGLVPVFELIRQGLDVVPGLGIASRGPVRSIALAANRPLREIQTLAADTSSRTSVQLARVILERRYGVSPAFRLMPPDAVTMLQRADAALLIGDNALRLNLARHSYCVYDLGQEWVEMTGLPMVYAVWAGVPGAATAEVARVLRDSYLYGRERIDEIAAQEGPPRGFTAETVREYLTENIAHELGPKDYEGMELFLRYARTAQGQLVK